MNNNWKRIKTPQDLPPYDEEVLLWIQWEDLPEWIKATRRHSETVCEYAVYYDRIPGWEGDWFEVYLDEHIGTYEIQGWKRIEKPTWTERSLHLLTRGLAVIQDGELVFDLDDRGVGEVMVQQDQEWVRSNIYLRHGQYPPTKMLISPGDTWETVEILKDPNRVRFLKPTPPQSESPERTFHPSETGFQILENGLPFPLFEFSLYTSRKQFWIRETEESEWIQVQVKSYDPIHERGWIEGLFTGFKKMFTDYTLTNKEHVSFTNPNSSS